MERVPIQNIYYLLCYAWNHLQEAKYANVRSESCDTIWDLLAKVLVRGSQQIAKRGLHRSYVSRTERRIRPKGKILFTQNIRQPRIGSASVLCSYDELDPDILPNQIIRATLRLLQRHPDLSPEIRRELDGVFSAWRDFTPISVTARTFGGLQLHRNMRHYRFALHVCQLIQNQHVAAEGTGGGRFRDFRRDDALMGKLFEEFVRTFYRKEQSQYRVSSPQIQWATDEATSTAEGIRLLPSMETDIVLEGLEDRIIIDCKFYRDAFQRRFDTKKFISGHLYQIFAYLKNQELRSGWESARGMLLYPAGRESLREQVTIHGHQITILSINLNQDWTKIAEDLLGLIRS